MFELIDKLNAEKILSKDEFITLISNQTPELNEYAFKIARELGDAHYGKHIYIRGLIEFTNHCKNDCYYCGLRAGNKEVKRYRLSKEQILDCCEAGYELGFRTFVLQGGEDYYFSDAIFTDIIYSIRTKFPDCAITLSVGERSYESYKAYFDAGANRFLLRHETFNPEHYNQLHPKNLSALNRQDCLRNLKKIGFQVGTGFMVGSPYQTSENLADDMLFIAELNPHMVGIGPFITHKDTPFNNQTSGTLEQTLFMLSLIRIMLPKVLLPSTTALGTIAPNGRELGILAGANVVMPNLSPADLRKDYSLYDNKIATGAESAQNLVELQKKFDKIGYKIAFTRGDSKNM